MTNAALVTLAKRLRELKDQKEKVEGTLSQIEREIKEIAEDKLPAMMDDNDIEKFSVDGVGTIYQTPKVYAYVRKGDEDLFHDWLRANGHGDLIRAYVFPQTLNAFAKEQIEAGVDLPDWLNAAKVSVATLRRK